MALVTLDPISVKQGTTWSGLPDINIDPPVATTLARVVIQFRKNRKAAVGQELSTDAGSIVIDDAALWEFHVPRIALTLAAGAWKYDVYCEDSAGDSYIWIEGVLRVLPAYTRPA